MKIIMAIIARYDFERGSSPRFRNAHYEREYGRQYAVAAIFNHLSEELENG